jgi:membrane protein implicated in regulation of membrane protease activity
MDWLIELYRQQPFWVWLAVGAMILTAEVATGSGWLLWAAASAAAVGYVAMLAPDMGLGMEIILWSVLSVVSTFAAKRFLPSKADPGDINDNVERLIGRTGQATSAFNGGYGRVAVEGCEWAAQLEHGETLPEGAKIEVAALTDGARLLVRSV